MLGNAHQADEINAQDQHVVTIKEPFVQVAMGQIDQAAEKRRRVSGVGKPVVLQEAIVGPGQAVQEILVLV